jgi:hypothetical protein
MPGLLYPTVSFLIVSAFGVPGGLPGAVGAVGEDDSGTVVVEPPAVTAVVSRGVGEGDPPSLVAWAGTLLPQKIKPMMMPTMNSPTDHMTPLRSRRSVVSS